MRTNSYVLGVVRNCGIHARCDDTVTLYCALGQQHGIRALDFISGHAIYEGMLNSTATIVQSQINPDSYLSVDQLAEVLPFMRSFKQRTILKWVKERRFPAPITVTSKARVWRVGDIFEWLQAKSGKLKERVRGDRHSRRAKQTIETNKTKLPL